jgi:hypothetical protein
VIQADSRQVRRIKIKRLKQRKVGPRTEAESRADAHEDAKEAAADRKAAE